LFLGDHFGDIFGGLNGEICGGIKMTYNMLVYKVYMGRLWPSLAAILATSLAG
jgi:hypothetical protein